MLRAKFHVVSSLLTDFDASAWVPENENTVYLASFVVIMLLHKGFTHIHSQIKPKLLSGESFTLRDSNCLLFRDAHLPIHCPSSHLESLWNSHAPTIEAEQAEVRNMVNPDLWPSICWVHTTFKLHSAAQRKGAGEELHHVLNITFQPAATLTSFTS